MKEKNNHEKKARSQSIARRERKIVSSFVIKIKSEGERNAERRVKEKINNN